jgi:hypothetical protein
VPQFAHVMCGVAFTMLCARSLSTTIVPHFEQASMFKPQQKISAQKHLRVALNLYFFRQLLF